MKGAANQEITNNSDNNNISYFPNPTMDALNLESDQEIISYVITGLDGRTVMNSNVQPENKSVVITVSNLTPGLYIVKITLKSGLSKVIKFSKL